MKCTVKNVTLVSLVEKYECLWNRNSPLYKNTIHTNVAWMKIAEKVGETPRGCWTRWIRLCRFYTAERKKNGGVRKGKKNSMARRMAFLDGRTRKEEMSSALSSKDPATELSEVTEEVVDNYRKLVAKTANDIMYSQGSIERDCNKAFLISLLPYLKEMNPKKNMVFREECMKLVKETLGIIYNIV